MGLGVHWDPLEEVIPRLRWHNAVSSQSAASRPYLLRRQAIASEENRSAAIESIR